MRGVPRARCAMRSAPPRRSAHRGCGPSAARCARSRDAVELEPLHDAEAVAQRRGQQAGARGGADQRERRQIELDGTRGRALADHDVELVVLHRRIEHFLDHRAQAMDLIDEQHIARLQIGQDRRQVAGPLQHRSGGLAQADAEFGGDDVRQRRLAQARRSEDQHVIERLGAHARGIDEDRQLRLDLLLADVVGQRARTNRLIDGLLGAARSGAHQPLLLLRAHARSALCSARRISSSVLRLAVSAPTP
jgi:hypothetical protein